jgi:ArsR family transcriptional regulator, arsenate/arsenite/antimonite-responsive transcriptional repressor
VGTSTMMAGTKVKGQRAPFKPVSPLKVSPRTINGLAQVFKLLSDESRLKILLALAQDGELHVTALCSLLNQTQPAVSHHLTLLRMVGLVGYRRDGKHNYYHVDTEHVTELLEQFFTDSENGHRQITFDGFSIAYRRSK